MTVKKKPAKKKPVRRRRKTEPLGVTISCVSEWATTSPRPADAKAQVELIRSIVSHFNEDTDPYEMAIDIYSALKATK